MQNSNDQKFINIEGLDKGFYDKCIIREKLLLIQRDID